MRASSDFDQVQNLLDLIKSVEWVYEELIFEDRKEIDAATARLAETIRLGVKEIKDARTKATLDPADELRLAFAALNSPRHQDDPYGHRDTLICKRIRTLVGRMRQREWEVEQAKEKLHLTVVTSEQE